ncbi:hypothetical protein E8E12_009214 [Didymella heteroderae]|uniref:Uncharacterized protein n=1 Tax=Didymella heteroderae TaxID=1769908 RepID=A0A9P5C2J5_9PLEO|nr:hypothetical protein E8E12_009214 [Didymella heteroderae]
MSLETTSSPDKTTKKAKRKTQKATTAQGQEPISKQAQKAATSKKTKKNRGTKKTFQTATSPDQSGSKPKTTASQKRKARKETQASHAVAGNDEQLAASTCASESAKVEKTAGQAKQEVTQEDAVYETWLDY